MRLEKMLLLFHFIISTTQKCTNPEKLLQFYKTRNCYKSKTPIMSWKSVISLNECKKFARERKGMAFNYSPPEINNKLKNCQILACPEPDNSTDLVFDPAFDYYTAFGDSNSTSDATCFKTIGIFKLIEQKLNYTSAASFCSNLGGDLADVLTEMQTNSLAGLLQSLENWYKAAYVGLDDINKEGIFENPMGAKLECSYYRAWAVGHPRPFRIKEDCVILDEDKTWKSINCKIKRPFICEFYSSPPDTPLMEYKYKNCNQVTSQKAKKKCLRSNEAFKLFNKSSRIDQCALMNNFD